MQFFALCEILEVTDINKTFQIGNKESLFSRLNKEGLPVSAGIGQFLDSDRFSEIEVGDEVAASADFGVRVAGDSMEPLYLDGQIIWIHKQDTLEEGEIGIFFLDGEAYVKKYHQTDSDIQLISLNSKYSPINVSSESTLKTFGKVVG